MLSILYYKAQEFILQAAGGLQEAFLVWLVAVAVLVVALSKQKR